MKTSQYTLRGIPERLDRRLRDLAKARGRSLNAVAVEALERGSGGNAGILEFDDMDDLIGTWQPGWSFSVPAADSSGLRRSAAPPSLSELRRTGERLAVMSCESRVVIR